MRSASSPQLIFRLLVACAVLLSHVAAAETLQSKGADDNPAMVSQIFEMMDKDGDGTVSLNEFVATSDEGDAEEAGEPQEDVGAGVAETDAEENTTPEIIDTYTEEDNIEPNDPSDGNVAVVSDNLKIQQREKAVISAFQPVWFASSHGWDGTTYDAAVDFCESYDHMVLCPFSAYCPNGPGTPPLSGSMVLEIDGEEWAPVNGPPNSWVQLGTISGEPNSRCALYHDLLGNRPQWGLDGSKPELKHHVMCCLM